MRRPPWRARKLAAANRAQGLDAVAPVRRWRRERFARLTVRSGAQTIMPPAMVVALEAVLMGLYRRSDGVWCYVTGSAPVSPSVQYALVDVVGNGMVDVHEERAVMQGRGWLALAVARPRLVG